MKYMKADEVFPKELIIEMQKYAQGQIVYIPKPEGNHKKWGENSGNREYLKQRNQTICEDFKNGATMIRLSERYCLSIYSIKKIVYSKKIDRVLAG